MAKFNNNPNNKFKNNYFKQMIQRYGSDFLEKKKQERGGFTNEPPRVFRDLVKGKIDFARESDYFRDPEFLEALILNAYKNYTYYGILNNSLTTTFAQKPIPITMDEQETYIRVKDSFELYRELYNCLIMFRSTGNIDWIIKIPYSITNKNISTLIS